MANNFNYYSPTEIVFGRGAQTQVAAHVQKYGGTRVLVVYGSQRVVRSGLLDSIIQPMEQAGIRCFTLGGVVPNPHLSKVYEGIEIGKREGIDFLLAVGGGSAIDTAKAIGYGLAEPDKDVWELYESKRTARGCLPVASVLTIAAAGSESSNSSVITNEKTGEKRSYNDNLARPKFAAMNPELTMTLPDYQTESGCTDIMMHTMERYFTSQGNMELTDAIAEALLRTVMAQAKILHTHPDDYDARAEVMWAGSLAHNDLTGCGNGGGDFATHALEHELGGMFDVTHGAGLAALWPSWARYVCGNIPGRFARYAVNVMGVTPGATEAETAEKGIQAMEAFYREIGMPTSMRELGIDPTDEQLHAMAHSCASACGGSKGSARLLHEEDMYNIYKMAL
ncbi:iron-containing alcohol dehydrogenase [uncultured Subdoligranulum sp.]|uniref:iron-containing alcohol dehydrogenase n=1 Tax=uncultured Subdoligranulum sp. TaxID=512298 RepID=UPI0032082CE7